MNFLAFFALFVFFNFLPIFEFFIIFEFFTIFEFFRFFSILVGRMDHHGEKEIFKTQEIKKADLDMISKKIAVMKMKEYTMKKNNNEIKEEEEVYVVR